MIRRFFSDPPFPGGRLLIHGIGIRERMAAGFINRPQGTGDFLIMIFHSPARAGSAPDAVEIGPETLFIWSPGQPQYYGQDRRAYSHSWIHCDGSLVRLTIKDGQIPTGKPMAMASARVFVRFLLDMYREIATQEFPDERIASHLFENWGLGLSRVLRAKTSVIPEKFRRIREYMDLHHSKPMTLESLAALAHCSPSHFSAEFRRHIGVPPIHYLIQARMQHAIYLLRDSEMSVTEIANRCGYEDIFYFSKLFKKIHSLSPKGMREQLARI